MGLDMYLYQNHSLADYDFAPAKKEIANKIYSILGVSNIAERNITLEIKVPVAYWRKANAIHAWFVENIQDGVDDCREYYVSRENLIKLKSICAEVLEDHSKAKDLLPTSSGFFFGSEDYDEWYFKDIEYTRDRLNILIISEDFEKSGYIYESSW